MESRNHRSGAAGPRWRGRRHRRRPDLGRHTDAHRAERYSHTERPERNAEYAGPTGKEAAVQDFLSKLAANLGISQNDLEQAIRTTDSQLLDQAVADGKITEVEAQKIRDRIASGDVLFPFRGRGHGHGHGFGCGFEAVELLGQTAAFLGVTAQDVMDGLHNNQSLAQIAEAHGKTADGLSSYLYDQLKTCLDQAVQNGRITQAQEDTILSNAQARIAEIINHAGPFFGGPHGFWKQGETPDGAPLTPGGTMDPAQEDGLFF